ncbi:hypothetical protein [Mycobacterium sp. URHB0021]
MKKPEDSPRQPWDQETAWSLTDRFWGDESTDMAGFSQREEDEFLLAYGPRKVRKAIIARRTADMNERQRDAFLLRYGSRRERRAIKHRQEAREQAAEQGADGYTIW